MNSDISLEAEVHDYEERASQDWKADLRSADANEERGELDLFEASAKAEIEVEVESVDDTEVEDEDEEEDTTPEWVRDLEQV